MDDENTRQNRRIELASQDLASMEFGCTANGSPMWRYKEALVLGCKQFIGAAVDTGSSRDTSVEDSSDEACNSERGVKARCSCV